MSARHTPNDSASRCPVCERRLPECPDGSEPCDCLLRAAARWWSVDDDGYLVCANDETESAYDLKDAANLLNSLQRKADAAPDLLAALRGMMETAPSCLSTCDGPCRYCEARIDARAAIARAEGR